MGKYVGLSNARRSGLALVVIASPTGSEVHGHEH